MVVCFGVLALRWIGDWPTMYSSSCPKSAGIGDHFGSTLPENLKDYEGDQMSTFSSSCTMLLTTWKLSHSAR